MKKTNLVVLLTALTAFTSCISNRKVYAPSLPNNPMFSQKGDVVASVHYSTGNLVPTSQHIRHGIDVQAAYSPINKLAFTYSYMNRSEKDVDADSEGYLNIFDSSVIRYKRNMQEFGVGTYLYLNRQKDVTINIYGGYGRGTLNINESGNDERKNPYTRYLKSNINKWFVQCFFTMLPSYDHFSVSVGSRLSFVSFSNLQSDYANNEKDYFGFKPMATRTLIMYEPAAYMRYKIEGAEWLSLNFSFGFSFHLRDNPSTRLSNASMGIGVDPFALFKK